MKDSSNIQKLWNTIAAWCEIITSYDDIQTIFIYKLRKKESVFGVILVRILPAFSRIWTEYGEIVSLRIQSECGKMREKWGSE